jgi:hypothetical protein
MDIYRQADELVAVGELIPRAFVDIFQHEGYRFMRSRKAKIEEICLIVYDFLSDECLDPTWVFRVK